MVSLVLKSGLKLAAQPLQSDVKQAISPTIFVYIDAKRSENKYPKEREPFGSDFNDLCTVS